MTAPWAPRRPLNACTPDEGLRILPCRGSCAGIMMVHRAHVGAIEFGCTTCGTARFADPACRASEVPPWAAELPAPKVWEGDQT